VSALSELYAVRWLQQRIVTCISGGNFVLSHPPPHTHIQYIFIDVLQTFSLYD